MQCQDPFGGWVFLVTSHWHCVSTIVRLYAFSHKSSIFPFCDIAQQANWIQSLLSLTMTRQICGEFKVEEDFEWKAPFLIHPKSEKGQESLHFIKVYVRSTMHFWDWNLNYLSISLCQIWKFLPLPIPRWSKEKVKSIICRNIQIGWEESHL